MNYDSPLLEAILLRRYKRFLADVRLPDQTELTVHVPNTGSLLGCLEPGSRVWIRDSGNPGRRYRHTWEQVQVKQARVGINTHLANALVGEALDEGLVPTLRPYTQRRAEVVYGTEGSRIDWLLTGPGLKQCFLEVKNVTAAVQDGVALFPDAVSVRAQKHLRELMAQVEAGQRSVLVFCVQRDDVQTVAPADLIDPVYGKLLRQAVQTGVEVLGLGAVLSDVAVTLTHSLAVSL